MEFSGEFNSVAGCRNLETSACLAMPYFSCCPNIRKCIFKVFCNLVGAKLYLLLWCQLLR